MDILIPHAVPGTAPGRHGRTDLTRRDWTLQIGRRNVQILMGTCSLGGGTSFPVKSCSVTSPVFSGRIGTSVGC